MTYVNVLGADRNGRDKYHKQKNVLTRNQRFKTLFWKRYNFKLYCCQSVITFTPYSDRVEGMMMQLKANVGNMKVIQVYAPTADKEEEAEEFYTQQTEVLRSVNPCKVTIMMGDINAKVGNR